MNRSSIKKLSLVTSLILFSSMFVGCSGEYNNNNNAEDNKTNAVVTQEPKIEGETIQGEIGKEVVNEDIGITIKNLYNLKFNEDFDQNYIYIGVYTEIANKSDIDRKFSNITSFGVTVDGQTEIDPNLCFPAKPTMKIKQTESYNLLDGTVAPGTMLDGLAVFAMPKDAEGITLSFFVNVSKTTGHIDFHITPDMLEEITIS